MFEIPRSASGPKPVAVRSSAALAAPPGVASAMHYSFPLLESLTSTHLDRFQFRR